MPSRPEKQPVPRLSSPGLRLTVGPPASGKTTAMVEVARAACARGERVWWVALPHQRAYVFRRVTAGDTALLGLEVMSAQQAFYRVLSAAAPEECKPLLVGTARIVQVAEAMRGLTGATPTPGETKLFAAAIAEAKRFEVPASELDDLPNADEETARLSRVYGAYQDSLAGWWDYDDVRSQAARLVETAPFAALYSDAARRRGAGLPDVVVVDGWRDLGPLDWRFLRGIAEHADVRVTLPEAPDGLPPDEVLEPGPGGLSVERYAAVNPVQEARWVLRSVKRDLAGGLDPLDVAIVAPADEADGLLALADEYGVPLTDERGSAIADTAAGRTLLDLLELRDVPTPARLLAIPELAPVASTALRLGVTGADSLARVARSVGLQEALQGWLARLQVTEDPVVWTERLLREVLPLSQVEVPEGFGERVLAAAKHAARLAGGDGFRAWLAALLRDVRAPRDRPGGVGLLDANLASGRRFARCYVMGATVGAYQAGEREDYFVPDEGREASPVIGSLPRRFAGGDRLVVAELLTRGDTTVITSPSAGIGGKLVADERLVGDPDLLEDLPPLPAGSPLELDDEGVYLPTFDPVPVDVLRAGFRGDAPDAEWLRVYAEQCALLAWGRGALGLDAEVHEPVTGSADADVDRHLDRLLEPVLPEEADWMHLVAELKSEPTLTGERLDRVAAAFPWAADWLASQRDELTALAWGPLVVDEASGVVARVDAGRRQRGGRRAVVYRFVEPVPPRWDGEKSEWHWAGNKVKDRWSEYLAALAFLERSQRVEEAHVVVWPVLGRPITYDRSRAGEWMQRRIDAAATGALEAMKRLNGGYIAPTPGRWCETCPIFYVCRVGRRL